VTWAILEVMQVTRSHQAAQYDTKISGLNSQIATLKTTEQTYDAINTVVSQAKKLQTTSYTFGPTWQVIRNNVPKDVQFTSVTMGSDSVFQITGVTKSITDVAQFTQQLGKQTGFSMVLPLSIDKQPTGTLFNFSLSFKVNPALANAKATSSGGTQ
jgi:Tfp pilus assembly protein PilN